MNQKMALAWYVPYGLTHMYTQCMYKYVYLPSPEGHFSLFFREEGREGKYQCERETLICCFEMGADPGLSGR